MEKLRELLEEMMSEELIQIVLSGRRTEIPWLKVKVRPLRQKDQLVFQASAWDGKKEFHINCGKQEMVSRVQSWIG